MERHFDTEWRQRRSEQYSHEDKCCVADRCRFRSEHDDGPKSWIENNLCSERNRCDWEYSEQNSGTGQTDASAYGTASMVYDAAANNAEDAVVTSDSTDATKDKYIDITTSASAAV